LEANIPHKRKSDGIDDVWKLRLCYEQDIYIVEIPSNSSLSFLTELVFRCLNMKEPTSITHIGVYHGSTHLTGYDSTSLNSTAIKDGDSLRVVTTAVAQPTVRFYGLNSMYLVKLYHGPCDKAQACFWVSKDTEASLLSLLIRYWHWSESDLIAGVVFPSKLEV